jgi:hypothetical protein
MRIEMKKFGDLLISRPAGREAFLAASAYLIPTSFSGEIELDFEGVKVLAPSWADEFISGLKSQYSNPIKILPSKNPSVIESLKILE